MKTETKMAILRLLATQYYDEYKAMRKAAAKYSFYDFGLRSTGQDLAADMAASGASTQHIADIFKVNRRSAQRWVKNGQIYSLDKLKKEIYPHLMILSKHNIDCQIINDLLNAHIPADKISKALDMPTDAIQQMASEAPDLPKMQ